MKPGAIIEDSIDKKDDIIALYYKDITKYHPLKSSEEAQCAKKIKKGNRAAIHKLVTSNLRFVVSVARNYQAQGIELVDLINIGNIGLIKAAMRFDEKKNFKFISYAVWWIRQSILQALADQSRAFRIPVNRIAQIYRIRKTIDLLEQRNKRYPQSEEIAAACAMSEVVVDSTRIIAQKYVSLDTPIGADNDILFLDLLEDNSSELPDTGLINESFQKKLKSSLGCLSEREKEVVVLYFGLDEDKQLTLSEISKRFNLTRERVRQIRDKALIKLKKSQNFKNLFKEYFNY